jgi:thiopeptide-type bacteriocin biosynthesis protein
MGLLSHLNLSTYQPQNGRYGHGSAMVSAEDVCAADSAAALAQISMAVRLGMSSQAVAAVSMVELAVGLATMPEEGLRWLVDLLPRERGKLDRSLRESALSLADTTEDPALHAHSAGEAVAVAWERRLMALTAYRARLAGERDPATVLRSLLHDHYVRAVGVDPDRERVTNRLARAVAQVRLARGLR